MTKEPLYQQDSLIDINELLDTTEETTTGYQLIVHNDDVNTFEWVIESLIDICKHTEVQAEQCSLIIHYKGKASVKRGERNKLKPLRESLTDRGINATIE